MSNKGDLTQITIEAGINHTQTEVMIVSTDSSAHQFVKDYAETNGYAIKEVPYGSESVPTRNEHCLLDAEQTGVSPKDLCGAFLPLKDYSDGTVYVRVLDENTGVETVAKADVIMQHKDGYCVITGFIQPKRWDIEVEGTTSRSMTVVAPTREDAEELAWHELDSDPEVSGAWKDSARIINAEEIKDEC